MHKATMSINPRTYTVSEKFTPVNESPLFINIFFIKRSLFFNLLFTHHNSLPLERRKYLIGLAKERYLIKKLARFTMQAKDVKIRANFSDVILDAFQFTKAVMPEGLEKFSAKGMISNNKYEFYKNKELFTLHLAVPFIYSRWQCT